MDRETIERIREGCAGVLTGGSLLSKDMHELCNLALDALRYKTALEFYADEESYKDQDNSCSDPGCCTPFPQIPVIHDDGDKARQALQGTGGEG